MTWSGAVSTFERLFLPTPTNQSPLPLFPDFWIGAVTIAAVALLFASIVDQFGMRRPLLYLAGILSVLAIVSTVVSWFFFRDIMFLQLVIAVLFSAAAVQVARLP